MASGKVRWFNGTKGYGFIVPDEGGPDVFLHMKDVKKAGIAKLEDGQALEYEITAGKEGKPRASEIKQRIVA